MKSTLTIAMIFVAITQAISQREFYLILDDRQNQSLEGSHGLLLDGFPYETMRSFMFTPGLQTINFVPLDSAIVTQEFSLVDIFTPQEAVIEIQVFRAIDKTQSKPEIITQKDIDNRALPPFRLSDGDQVVIRLKKSAETSSR